MHACLALTVRALALATCAGSLEVRTSTGASPFARSPSCRHGFSMASSPLGPCSGGPARGCSLKAGAVVPAGRPSSSVRTRASRPLWGGACAGRASRACSSPTSRRSSSAFDRARPRTTLIIVYRSFTCRVQYFTPRSSMPLTSWFCALRVVARILTSRIQNVKQRSDVNAQRPR